MTLTLHRRLFGPDTERGMTRGKDVLYLKRPLNKTEDSAPLPGPPYDDAANRNFFQAVVNLRTQNGDKRSVQVFSQIDLDYLVPFMDSYDKWRYKRFKVPAPPLPPAPPLVYPFPLLGGGSICQGPHYTAGIPGNVAIDFCDRPLDPILCVESGTVRRFSGHDPNDDTWDAQGVFGWSTYVITDHGYDYFYTHQGRREPGLLVGQRIEAGEILGYVGDQHFRPDHTHIGVSSPLGYADATKRITAVSVAPRVKPVI